MTIEISGTVEDTNGTAISGATVYVVRESDDTVVATTTSDSAGEYQVTGLDDTETYHVGAQYDDGSTKYHGESYPFVEPFNDTGPIDDFEDSDLVEYSGDKISFEVQTGTVFEGTYALEMGNDNGSFNSIHSSSGLPRYPTQESVFKYRCYMPPSGIAEMFFGYSDSDNHYRARVSARNGGIVLYKEDGGFLTSLASDIATIPTGEWLEVVVNWGNPDNDKPIKITLNDASGSQVADASAQDGTFTSGGIGWRAVTDEFSDETVYWDIAELTTVGGSIEKNLIIDDFEDGGISEYQGDTGQFTAQTNTVFEGTYALKGDTGTNGGGRTIESTSGLDNYPTAGDEIEFYCYRTASGDNPGFSFAVEPGERRYNVEIFSGQISIKKFYGGSNEDLNINTNVTIPENEWLRCVVNWGSDGTITLTVYDANDNNLGSVSATEKTFTEGGIGYLASNTGNVSTNYHDLAQINSDGSPSISSPQICDDFEDGDISEYDSGNGISVSTDRVYSGTYALKCDASVSSGTRIKSGAGLDIYPQRGDTFEYRVYHTTGDPNFSICRFGDRLDGNNRYNLFVSPGNEYRLQKVEGGSGTDIATDSNVSPPTDEWLRSEVEWGSSTIICRLYNASGTKISEISATDGAHDHGGIGWRNPGFESSANIYYDECIITNVG
jgi:hypothetical protein